jgi:hypothetical protein
MVETLRATTDNAGHDGWRYTAYDVSLLVERAGLSVEPLDPGLPQAPPNVHHALADARWVRDLYRAVSR